MPARFTVNPEMVVLARKARGKTQKDLSSLVGISQALLAKYEAGTRDVSKSHLPSLAGTLDFPESFFMQQTRVEGAGRSEIFHRKRNKVSAGVMDRAYAEAQIRRLEISSMLESVTSLPVVPSYPVDEFEDDPEKIARTVRAFWQLPPGPVFNVTQTLEENGCVVVAHDFGSHYIDGFSHRSLGAPPFFHVNAKLPPDRWRWTLVHELAHVIMHFEPGEPQKTVERQADLFAAEFLAPRRELLPLLFPLNLQTLAALKREWKISMQALVMRAHDLGVINVRQKAGMFAMLSKAGYRMREPETLDPPVEQPTCAYGLTQHFVQDLEFSRLELCRMLHVNERDFRTFYRGPEDWLGEILEFEAVGLDTAGSRGVRSNFDSLDLGYEALPLHIQVGCHPEDINSFQESLDALLLLQREGLIPNGILDMGFDRLRHRLEQEFISNRPNDQRWNIVDDLPF